jgi:hypothetical protein
MAKIPTRLSARYYKKQRTKGERLQGQYRERHPLPTRKMNDQSCLLAQQNHQRRLRNKLKQNKRILLKQL